MVSIAASDGLVFDNHLEIAGKGEESSRVHRRAPGVSSASTREHFYVKNV